MRNSKDNYLTVRIFDVGHGDSILIEFPGKKKIGVIDCFAHGSFSANKYQSPIPKVRTFLANNYDPKTYEVEFIYLTHYHYDHYMGLSSLLEYLIDNNIPINQFWDPGISKKKFINLRALFNKKGSPITRERATELQRIFALFDKIQEKSNLQYRAVSFPNYRFQTISNTSCSFIAPNGNHWNEYCKYLARGQITGTSAKEHLVCSSLVLRFGKSKVLFASDITNSAWEKIVANSRNRLLVDCIKVSHHGSSEGNFLPNDTLWDKISKKNITLAAISGGYRKNIVLDDTINQLKENKVRAFCTGNYFCSSKTKITNHYKLSSDIIDLFNYDSSLLETQESYHGDLTFYVHADGKVRYETEYPTKCI